MQTPKFTQVRPSFHAELKSRINQYFEQSGRKMTGNYKLWLKALIAPGHFYWHLYSRSIF